MSAPYLTIDVPDDNPAGVVNRMAVVGIDATDATLGQVATAIDDPDNPGRTIAAFQDAGTDPGVPTGEPGSMGPIALSEGDPVICTATSAATRIPEFASSPIALNLTNVGSLKLEVPVIAAGPTGTKIGVEGVRFVGDTPTLLGVFVLVDSVNTISGKTWANQGAYVDVPDSFRIANVQLCPVVYDGDDSGEVIFGNVQLFAVAVASDVPPTPENPGPEIPQSDTLVARWYLTEGSGQSVANKEDGSSGLPALMVGSTTGSDADDTTWATGPRRMNAVGYGSFLHKFCRYVFSAGEATALTNGFAIFLPFKINSGPGDKYVFGIVNSIGGRLASLFYNAGLSNVPQAFLASTGGTVTSTATGAAVVNGDWMWAGLIYTGSRLKIVVNDEVLGDVAVGSPLEITGTGTYVDFGWPGTNVSFAQGADDMDFGDPYVFIATGMDFTDAELLELYAFVKLTYTDLP